MSRPVWPHKIPGTPDHWVFYGNPGHFVGADSCRFFIHTHVGPGLRYCVSTVGDYHPAGREQADAVGSKRLYETMVFDWQGSDPWTQLATLGYNDAARARDGHIEVCFAWDRKDDDEP